MSALQFEPTPRLPKRQRDGHKGTFETVLVVGGCAHDPRHMLGGAMLAARGAFRSGAGRVIAAVPAPHAATALLMLPEATVISLPTDARGELIASAAAHAIDAAMPEVSAVVIGPALGRSAAAGQVVMRLLAMDERPRVIDADAIGHFASHADAARDLRGTVIFTPHPGEARVLCDALQLELDCVQRATRPAAALSLAQRLGAIVVLKGAGTVTSDGLRAWRCDAGSAALATGGSGDVLAGGVAAMHAQFGGASGVTAQAGAVETPGALSALAVELHARAGELWSAAHGDAGALAHEIADLIPDAMQQWRDENQRE